jgi:curved DNA-binding protein CbpA
LKDYYTLLEVEASASQDEIKRAFRLQIARYHPDKVQHLGTEFQAMAAERAADLTEAYRILSDEGRRGEYDRARAANPASAPSSATKPSESAAPVRPEPESPRTGTDTGPGASKGAFSQERATRDEYVRKATIGRFRQVFAQEMGRDYDESPMRGFDVAFSPKAKLFGRGKGPRLLARFVSAVDAAAIADAWAHIAKLNAIANEDVCIFLMGTAVASRRELEDAIAAQRRKGRGAGAKVSVIPIDARVWDAHVPVDAPAAVKNLLARLRGGT